MKYHVSFDLEFRPNPYPGRLIAIEGIDGSGKTTQAKEVVKRINKEGLSAAYTKEPTDMVIGQFIREKILSGNMQINPLALQYLFNSDRVMHMEKIEELLEKGYIIVMDRYFWSSVAYAMADLAESLKDTHLTMFSILSFYHQFIAPDQTFYLDVSLPVALERINASGKHGEIYDNGETLPEIQRHYEELMKEFPNEFVRISAERPQDEITSELVNLIKNQLPNE